MAPDLVFDIPNDLASIEEAVDFVMEQCSDCGEDPKKLRLNLRVGLSEAIGQCHALRERPGSFQAGEGGGGLPGYHHHRPGHRRGDGIQSLPRSRSYLSGQYSQSRGPGDFPDAEVAGRGPFQRSRKQRDSGSSPPTVPGRWGSGWWGQGMTPDVPPLRALPDPVQQTLRDFEKALSIGFRLHQLDESGEADLVYASPEPTGSPRTTAPRGEKLVTRSSPPQRRPGAAPRAFRVSGG